MKITVKQLKQLIREQVEEARAAPDVSIDPLQKAVKMLNKEWGQGMARPFKFYAQLDQRKLMRLVNTLRKIQTEDDTSDIRERLGLDFEQGLSIAAMDLRDPPPGFPKEYKAAGILVHAAEGSGEPEIIQKLALKFGR